jgi:hypothetical protein
MKTEFRYEPTFTATIYVGLRVGRSTDTAPRFHTIDEVRDVCQRYCDEIGLCVTVTPTEYIYKGGNEVGAAIGLINYPRFPKPAEEIGRQALELAQRLLFAMEQFKVSVVFPDRTVMLGEDAH